jgi:hypothetical protein
LQDDAVLVFGERPALSLEERDPDAEIREIFLVLWRGISQLAGCRENVLVMLFPGVELD